uniref:Uncharacterized protein n=1 Tax=Lutzomyia longipalpis TaxID=7200 RepID=A0A1B0CGM1_LUTLO
MGECRIQVEHPRDSAVGAVTPCEAHDPVVRSWNVFDVLFATVPEFGRVLECDKQETADVYQLEDLLSMTAIPLCSTMRHK